MGLFLFSLLFSISAHAAPDLHVLGESTAWKQLLHYQRSFFGAESSEVSGKNFFFSSTGGTDPVSELKATLAAFTKPLAPGEDENKHPVCRFPARLRFLIQKEAIREDQVVKLGCDGHTVYKNRIQTKKLSIVFSSYYLGSASSIFGHSFLRFSGDNDNELFDTGINFSATPTTENPALYAIFGLIGVFPATFSAQPFYYKVREYNDFESRDLWTYELNLSADERDFLLDHLWELGNTSFRYFYFNENCSYHILRAIEAAVPRIRFYNRRPIYVIPSETIQLLYHPASGQKDLVTHTSYRPSLRNVAYYRYSKLEPEDQDRVLHALYTKTVINPTESKHPADALDTLIDGIDLNFSKSILAGRTDDINWKQDALRTRALVPEISAPVHLKTPSNENPAIGHGIQRLVVSYGADQSNSVTQPYIDLQARASHHDLLDPSIGYPPNLHIDFGRIGFRYFTDPKVLVLQELTMVDLTALAVEHPLFSRISYDALITYDRTPFADCADPASCGAIRLKGGFGKAYSFLGNQVFFFLMNFQSQYGFHYFDSHFKVNVSPSANLLFQLTPRFKALLSADVGETAFTEHSLSSEESGEIRYSVDPHFGFGLKSDFYQQSNFTDVQASVRGFFYF